MSNRPTCCPHSDCPSRSGAPFSCRRDGHFQRDLEPRAVQRYECSACGRGFSDQTLRVDYRLKRPGLLERFFLDRVSKVTHRQSARNHKCSRSTEERHFKRLREHCRAFHDKEMASMAARGGLGETFLLDEQETFEHSRLKKPVTVPVLIEKASGFVFDARAGAMAPRGRKRARKGRTSPPAAGALASEPRLLGGIDPRSVPVVHRTLEARAGSALESAPQGGAAGQAEGAEIPRAQLLLPQNAGPETHAGQPPAPTSDAAGGPQGGPPPSSKPPARRRSESRAKVKQAFELLRECSPKDKPITVRTDMKKTYATLLRRIFGARCLHQRTISTRKRDTRNPLWLINHTLARTRDGLSRLVRRSWAASKLRQRLEGHLAIWICYRNYVRDMTNHDPGKTPAMALGLHASPWSAQSLLRLRVLP
ncbi:MAG: hypothetical protein IPK67_11035 [Planctomycetes bacterium]|nr:hypothetical protein [Planctomycetota bacterium]